MMRSLLIIILVLALSTTLTAGQYEGYGELTPTTKSELYLNELAENHCAERIDAELMYLKETAKVITLKARIHELEEQIVQWPTNLKDVNPETVDTDHVTGKQINLISNWIWNWSPRTFHTGGQFNTIVVPRGHKVLIIPATGGYEPIVVKFPKKVFGKCTD